MGAKHFWLGLGYSRGALMTLDFYFIPYGPDPQRPIGMAAAKPREQTGGVDWLLRVLFLPPLEPEVLARAQLDSHYRKLRLTCWRVLR